jgi:hypothetical protein
MLSKAERREFREITNGLGRVGRRADGFRLAYNSRGRNHFSRVLMVLNGGLWAFAIAACVARWWIS